MKLVIACASKKRPGAGRLRATSGEEVEFVADPSACISSVEGKRYATPEDPCGEMAMTWRDVLKRYNEGTKNPYGLLRAADLYLPTAKKFSALYHDVAESLGWDNVFILSAGWGLIRASFWTPYYDITFSRPRKGEDGRAFRDINDLSWQDFNHLQDASITEDEPIHFFGGARYLPKFYVFARPLPGTKVIHHKAALSGKSEPPPEFQHVHYGGPDYKNNYTWYYSAAKNFCDSLASSTTRR